MKKTILLSILLCLASGVWIILISMGLGWIPGYPAIIVQKQGEWRIVKDHHVIQASRDWLSYRQNALNNLLEPKNPNGEQTEKIEPIGEVINVENNEGVIQTSANEDKKSLEHMEFKLAHSNQNGYFITAYIGHASEVVIPSYIYGYPVHGIAPYAFTPKTRDSLGRSNSVLTKVIFEENIQIIGAYAFSNNDLTSIVFPPSLQRIEEAAFRKNKLSTIQWGGSEKFIGARAFYHNALKTLHLHEQIADVERFAFSRNQLVSINYPPLVTTIQGGVYANNQLEIIHLPSHIVAVEGHAFAANPIRSIRADNPETIFSKDTLTLIQP